MKTIAIKLQKSALTWSDVKFGKKIPILYFSDLCIYNLMTNISPSAFLAAAASKALENASEKVCLYSGTAGPSSQSSSLHSVVLRVLWPKKI